MFLDELVDEVEGVGLPSVVCEEGTSELFELGEAAVVGGVGAGEFTYFT